MKRVSHRKLRRAQSAKALIQTRGVHPLATSLARLSSAIAVVGALLAGVDSVKAGTFYWDTDTSTSGNNVDGTGLGGSGVWDLATSNWWDLATLGLWPNTNVDRAIFTGPSVGGSPTLNTVTLSSGITANRLSFFRSGYTLTGGDLTLAGTTPTLDVNLGESVTINSQILGTDGLTKAGRGSVRLGNNTNSYTGLTTISNGSLVIGNQGALGADSSAVVITGSSTRGFGGGQLVLDGGYTSGVAFTRDISLQGLGPIGGNGVALVSVRNNTISGAISNTSTVNTAIYSASGRLTMSDVNIAGTAGTTLMTFGAGGGAGVGSYAITGVLSGSGSIQKTGGGTLILNPSSASGFTGTFRLAAGSMRITSPASLGSNVGTGTSSTLDLAGDSAILEVRADTFTTTKGIYNRGGGSPIIAVDHAIGSSALNGTATFGNLSFDDGETITFNGRNGYGVALGTASVNTGDGNTAFANNLGGLLTFTGNFWSNSNSAAARTMTISGNGNTTINGNVIATGGASFDHILTKTGSGVLTITGTGSTLDGAVNVQGSLGVTDFRSIGNNTQNIVLGNATTTAGNLIIGTATAATVAGLTTSRPIIFNTTSASNSIYANQSGANPVILNGAITRPNATTAAVILGGTNTADNVVNVGIPNNGTGGVNKVGPGTWVLAAPNAYTGVTSISNGTLKLKANAAVSTILPVANDITFGNNNVYSGGTLEFVGQDGVNNVQTLDVLTTSSGANTIKLTPGVGGTASLTFTGAQATGGAGSVNFVGADFTNNKITFVGGANGLVSRTNYWNGADFAYRESTVLRAPVYGTDATFALAPAGAATLVASSNNRIDGDITAQTTVSVVTLKFNGSRTLTLGSGQTVTLSAGGVLATGGDSIITGGTALAMAASQAFVARVNLPGDSLTIGSVITGSTGLTKNGEGTLILSAANNQTGTVTINEGTVQLSGTGRLGAAADLTMRQDTTLDLNGVTPSTATNAFNNNGIVTNTSATGVTFTIGGASSTGTSFGIFSQTNGVINVTKTGTGAQSWLGNSTYTGVTTIGSTGLVTVDTLADINVASGIGKGDIGNNAASLVFNGSTGGLIYAGALRNGDLVLGSTSASTNRLFTLAGTGATLSSTTGNGNSIVFSNTGAIEHGGVVGPKTLILTGTSTGDNRLNPLISDSGAGADITSVTKTAAGKWVLGNSGNTYTGITTVAEGTLELASAGSLPSGSPLVLGSGATTGTLEASGNFILNLAAIPTAGTGSVTWGGSTGSGGFAASTGKLVVAIGGLATPTALQWGTGGFVGTGGGSQTLILNSTTALDEVEFRNDIDLNGAVRTITVNDNASTFTDFATITGAISGSGGISKAGTGVLQLFGANSYTGATAVTAGQLVVTSLGSSTSLAGTATSVGVSGIGTLFDDSNAITLGNAGTTAGILQYVGTGETSDRKIRLNTTTGSTQIHADGSGPLILTNVVNDMLAGSKALLLRGSNTAGNMITSVLADNLAGTNTLGITADGGATWILSGNNSYTGITDITAGALGAGHNNAFGTGTVRVRNGSLFAYGADRTIGNAISINSTTTAGTSTFIGDHNLNLTGAWNFTNTTAGHTFTNGIATGKTLTVGGDMAFNALTGNPTLSINGTGDTIINGNVATSTALNLNLTYSGTGSLTLAGTASDLNAGVVTISSGTLKIGANNVLNTATTANLVINPAVTITATLDLFGSTDTVRGITANSLGTAVIDNSSSSAASLTFGNGDQAVTFIGNIANSGTGALSITKTGTAVANFSGGTYDHKGATNVNGGSLMLAGNVSATTSLAVTGTGSLLALSGGFSGSTGVTSLEVGGGATLSLLNGAGNLIPNLTTLRLGNTGAGTATLNLNIGDVALGDKLNTDTITLLTGGTLNLGNTVTFNMTDAGLNANQTYTLLSSVSGGFSAFGLGNFIQGATPGGFDAFTWDVQDTYVRITTGNLIVGDLYWRGLTDTTWNADVNNWSTDKAGAAPALSTPGQGTRVIFQWDAPANTAVTTTLEQNFKINSLVFEASTTPANTPTAVTIDPGTLLTNRLEIAPTSSANGIAISAGGPASVTINSAFKLGANQTWTVADAASTLTISTGLQGEADVTKAGSGRVVLGGAADVTFNPGLTSDFTVTGGSLELTNVAALGTVIANNLANVGINGGAFYYNNATAGTVPNPLTLGGGTLSAGGNTQTYSGTVNISAISAINMRDSASAVTTAAARSITLSGVLSGSGTLTVDSNDTLAAGNAEGGTLTISNNANTWNGDLIMNRGTVVTTATNGLGGGEITFNQLGRIIVRALNGITYNLSEPMNFSAGALGEFSVDNTSGTLAADFVINQNGVLNIGSAGTGATVRLNLADAASSLNLTGGVVLGGNSSISVEGGDADSVVTISGTGISDGGNNYSLAINDEAGAWAVTSTRLAINVASTYTGGTSLNEGILLLGHKDALGTGGLNITGTSTITPTVDLSAGGVGPFANNLTLNGNLTIAGAQPITFSGTTTQSLGNRTLTNSLTAGTVRVNSLNMAEGAIARTLTIAGTGTTVIGTIINNGADNIVTNSVTAPGSLTIDTNIFLSEAAGTGRTFTINGAGSTLVSGLIADFNGAGVAGNLTYSGTGVLTPTNANTFTGGLTVSSGTLEFSTVSNIGGPASNLGQGTPITLGGALRFIGGASQATDRPITTTASSTLAADGTSGATITYNGTINQASGNAITLVGTGTGLITAGIIQAGTAADVNVNSGTWTLSGSGYTLADDVIVTGTSTGTAILNLNSTGVLNYTAGTSNGLYSRDGAVININAANVSGVANSGGLDFIIIADTPSGGAATVNMASGSSITSPRLDVGGVTSGRVGNVTGTGLITVTGTATDWSSGIRLFDGSVAADLGGVASMLKQGLADFTVSGNNSGLTGTVAATRLDAGNLILDYTTNNNNKISAAAALDMRGGTLTINGNNGAATTQSVASFTLGSGGANVIDVNGGTGQEAVLNLGAITRASASLDGTVRFILPAGTQSVTNGITTSTALTNGLVGVSAFATVDDGTGLWFATKSGANIVALASTPKNDVTTWVVADHITDETTGFTGTVNLDKGNINSLRFNAAGGSDLVVANGGILHIASGGILVTSSVNSGTPSLVGGTLASAATEVIVTQESAQTFEIASDIRINHALTKTGNGTLRLSGNNVYTDETDIQRGTLEVSGGNAIGDNSPVNLADDRTSTLRLLSNEKIGRLTGGSAATGLESLATVDIGTHTLTLNYTGANATYAGLYTGSGTIIKNGFGTNTNFQNTNSSTGFTGTVIVNEGLFYLSGIGRMDAAAFTVNKNASFMIDNNGTTSVGTRILDTASITLNSADGAWSNETKPSGLVIRRDQGSTQNETVGTIAVNSGASYTRLDATVTSAIATIIADNIVRLNNATLNVRGTNMTATSGQRAQLRIGTAGDQTTFISNMVGGGGALNSKTISIVPWAIAEEYTGGLGDANMGNSLASYVSGQGFRALNLTSEYNPYASAGTQDNTREALAADLTGLTGKTINSLVLHNATATSGAFNVTGAGAGQALAVTSGALLFTLNSAATAPSANGIVLGGFDDGITVGGTNEYVIHVVNPSSVAATPTLTATIGSPLTSAADITKSGRGALVLTEVNTAGGGARKTTINEGVLEIADLDNIGGPTGGLVFAGGTLRLGAAFDEVTDVLSTRSITFLNGGGTIDTNGNDPILAASVGSGSGGLTKAGLGNLTLNAAATYTGTTTITNGTLTIGANNATGNGGNVNVGAGATLDLGVNTITAGLVTTSGASPLITGTGTITATTGFFLNHTGDTTIGAQFAGSGGLLKAQTNTVALSGLSTYTGTTEVQAGTLSFDSIGNVGGGASALGNPSNIENGIIRLGLTTVAATLTYTGTGHASNRIIELQGTTGGATINGNGTGALVLGTVQTATAGIKTLTLSGTSLTAVNNSLGAINEVGSVLSVLKSGTNTWQLAAANNYTGTTNINEGILRATVNQNMVGGLNFGSANTIATAGTFDLSTANATFAGAMTVQTDSAVNTNILLIGAGKSLDINNNVVIGTGRGALSNTLFNASGAGTMNVTNLAAAAQFRVGGSSGSGNFTQADLSGLAALNVTLNGTDGIFRVNSTSTTNVASTYSMLKLAQASTITAATLAVGDGGQYAGTVGQINQLQLGTGLTTVNANAVNIGTGARDFGSVTFQDLVNGTLKIRAADSTSAAAFNMGTGTASTTVALAAGMQNVFDTRGHNADLLFTAMTIGTQNARAAAMANEFSFDTGTLIADSLTMGSKTAAGNSTNVMNLGGGAVNIGTGSGTAITLATNSNSGAVSSTLNITGGTVGVTGDIVRGNNTGAGSATGTINLAGGSLDMNGKSIGGANPIIFNAQSGTLSNLGQLNNGGTLAKTTGGTLVMAGTNSYTGPTNVSAGTLDISGSLGATSLVTLDNSGTLLLSGAGGEQVNDAALVNLNGGTLAFGSQSGVTETLGAMTLSSNSVLDFGVGDSNAFSFSSLSITGGSILSIYNWTGTAYSFPPESDHGGNQDRLLFGADVSGQTLSQIAFYDGGLGSNFLGSGAQISFNGGYEIVPVPEPSSTALIGAAGLLALVGYRERRRLSGALSRKSQQS